MGRVSVIAIVINCLAVVNGASALSLVGLGTKLARAVISNGDPCDGVDCPSYVLDAVGDGYVVRKYPAGEQKQ